MDESDLNIEIAALRQKGADRLDPVRFHFIEALAKRASLHEGAARRILDEKLGLVLAAYRERFEREQYDAEKLIMRAKEQTGQEQRSPLAELARYIAQHSPAIAEDGDIGSRAELKTIRNFRNTWSRLSVNKQIKQAIDRAPENAGPLNSHRLVLQSLGLMRDLSPDYLTRFMSYVDTLLVLDHADKKIRPMEKKPPTPKKARKPKAVAIDPDDALPPSRQL